MVDTPKNVTGSNISDVLAEVTHGTAEASKALIVDANLDIAAIRHLTVTGNLVTGATTISEADLAFIDGVTAGTALAGKAVVLTTDKHIDTIVIDDGGLKLGAGAGTAVTSTAAELNQLDASVAAVLAESAGGIMRTAVATYSFAIDGGAISAIPIGDALPDNALVLGGFVEVETTLTSATDAATVALSIVAANDIVVAVAISTGTPWDAGKHAIIPKFNTPETTTLKLTAANQVDVTIAVEAVTAGKFHVTLFYVMGF